MHLNFDPTLEYEIAEAPSLDALREVVKEMLIHGWIPQGGVMLNNSPNTPVYFQALVRNEQTRSAARRYNNS